MNDESELMGTSDVAAEAGVSDQTARDWAAENDVQRVGNIFVWSEEDRAAFSDDLTEDEEAGDEEEEEHDEDEADEEDDGDEEDED